MEGMAPMMPDERALDFIAELGFNFIRIPTDYRFWTRDFDYENPDEKVFGYIDKYLEACKQRNLHMCLNFHRAPGYCINSANLEKHILWLDKIAQDGFVQQWRIMAERYKGVDNKYLSFDLLNEPPDIGRDGFTRDIHEALIRRTFKEIRSIDPDREIVIDGLHGGSWAMPELADLDVIHSGRGYMPMSVTHYKARWWDGAKDLAEPVYPDGIWDNVVWNKDTLREHYKPWRILEAKGVKVHIGEFGCYGCTPNNIALAWFGDILSLYKEFKWGYSLWCFEGEFGIINHKRPGAVYENYKGYQVDRQLLDLLLENRVADINGRV